VLLDTSTFRAYLTDFHVYAWRWECLPSYGVEREQPVLLAWHAGEPKPADISTGWHERVRRITESGRTIGRVRGLRYPLSSYTQMELEWAYPGNAAAGEVIGVLDLTEHDHGMPDYDFWLVDDQHVIRMNYDDDGRLIGRELLDNPELPRYLEWKATAQRSAVSLSDVRT
jgi:hypothetical protein